MTELNRRELGFGLGAALAGATGGSVFAIAQTAPRVVVIGGGPGGATVAATIKREAPNVDVTLIEPSRVYTTCFFSNLYLGGFRSYESLRHNNSGLARLGVRIVNTRATDVNTQKKVVTVQGGRTYAYDRLVVAPGIDLKYDSIEGYSLRAAQVMPHAYLPGVQTTLLKSQLEKMRNGGTVVMAAPNNPFRCPPGPYERACMIAHFLKTRKPKSKLVILDPKRAFSKQGLFMEAFDKYYKGIIEMNLSNEIDDFTVTKVDLKTRMVTTKAGKSVKADVANIIPNQRAGQIAIRAGLAKGDWCPVKPESFASALVDNVYVLGDASIANEMPKSGFSANSQAKVVANDIVAVLAKKEKYPPNFRNTCWSLVAPNDGVKIGAGYVPKAGKLDPVGSFISKPGESADLRKKTYEESLGWYSAITTETFAKDAPAAKGKRKG
jgi:NADPH-dependent 2,4-dienoyl-CoA reductase/sulfur reductase-like enzyme